MALRWLRSRRGRRAVPSSLPLPPIAMRQLVGPLDDASYDNPSGSLAYPYLPPTAYEVVFDFGCGCGRVARRLMLQRTRPSRYVGIDLHAGMINWCRKNLAPHAPEFTFLHHDVYNVHFNPGPDKPREAPFPVEDGAFSLVNADSVFTHLTQEQAAHYLAEVARILRPDGVLNATWFFFDRSAFPMLHPENGAIYVSYVDPSAAVVFDRSWVTRTAAEVGLTVYSVIPPQIRGYQWTVLMTPARDGLEAVDIPHDTAPPGSIFLPELPPQPDRLGW